MKQEELDNIVVALGEHVTINREQITPAMIEQPGLYVYYALAHARALREERTYKLNIENNRAVVRRHLSRATTKRITEAMIDEACQSDKAFTKVQREHVEAQYCADVLEAVMRTFEHRREMLVNIGASVREEMRSIEMRTPAEPRLSRNPEPVRKRKPDWLLPKTPREDKRIERGPKSATPLGRMLNDQEPCFREDDIPF